MPTFEEYRDAVLDQALVCSVGAEQDLYYDNEDKVETALAAAAYVVNLRGVEWCAANPEEFVKATWSQLGFWVQVGIFFASLFTVGGPLWLQILGWILPYVIRWYTAQVSEGASLEDIQVLAMAAETAIKGTRHDGPDESRKRPGRRRDRRAGRGTEDTTGTVGSEAG